LFPQDIVARAERETKSDAYYKTLTTQKQLYGLLYGVITNCYSFNFLCKNLQFFENKLISIGIEEIELTELKRRLENTYQAVAG